MLSLGADTADIRHSKVWVLGNALFQSLGSWRCRLPTTTPGSSKQPFLRLRSCAEAAATLSLVFRVLSPVLDGAAAFLECKVVQMVDVGGDHDILVGEVISAEILKPGEVGDTLTLPDLGWSYAG